MQVTVRETGEERREEIQRQQIIEARDMENLLLY